MGKIRTVEIAEYTASQSERTYEQDLSLSFLFLFPQRACSRAKSEVENNTK